MKNLPLFSMLNQFTRRLGIPLVSQPHEALVSHDSDGPMKREALWLGNTPAYRDALRAPLRSYSRGLREVAGRDQDAEGVRGSADASCGNALGAEVDLRRGAKQGRQRGADCLR